MGKVLEFVDLTGDSGDEDEQMSVASNTSTSYEEPSEIRIVSVQSLSSGEGSPLPEDAGAGARDVSQPFQGETSEGRQATASTSGAVPIPPLTYSDVSSAPENWSSKESSSSSNYAPTVKIRPSPPPSLPPSPPPSPPPSTHSDASEGIPFLEVQDVIPMEIPNQSPTPPTLTPEDPISEQEELTPPIRNPVRTPSPLFRDRTKRVAYEAADALIRDLLDTSLERARRDIDGADQPETKRRREGLPNTPSTPRRGRRPKPKTPEQLKLLEAIFQKEAEPSIATIHELVDTGLTPKQIRMWFAQRRMGSQNDHSQMNRRFIPEARGAPSPGNRSDQAQPNSPNNRRAPRKYLKLPYERTSDISVIREDWRRLELAGNAEIDEILTGLWNVKALRLYCIAKRNQRRNKHIVLKEAKRLTEICRGTPLSEGHQTLIERWKGGFLRSKGDTPENRTILQDYISPWLLPFIYSKATKQGERYLTLELALYDFEKVFGRGQGYSWETPAFLQND